MKLENPEIRFEVTNRCNANCIMCPREKMSRLQGVLSLTLYARVLSEAAAMGISQVSLENFGEPLLDSHLVERVWMAKSLGMEVYTISNGSLLDARVAACLVRSGLDKIRISLYGTTKDVYESVHVGLNFDNVLENVRTLFFIRDKLGGRKPQIELYFLVLDENRHQVEDFIQTWGGIADGISVWFPHNWSTGRNYRPLGGRATSCNRPFNGPIQVQWDGRVVPCCFDYDNASVLGDLNLESLEAVIRGPRWEALRTAHVKGDFAGYPFCDRCDQLHKRDDVLLYTTIAGSRVGASNTNHWVLQEL